MTFDRRVGQTFRMPARLPAKYSTKGLKTLLRIQFNGRFSDLSICAQNVCNSDNLRRGSGSSSPNGSSSSSVNNSPISYSEYSMTGSANEESENEIPHDPG